MTTYSVYQIQLTNAQVDLINAEGHNAVPAHKAKMDMQFDFAGTGIATMASDAFAEGHYGKVCQIQANDLNEVFHIGNMGPETAIDRGPLNTRMSSISVGDIIEDADGTRFVVANHGFKPLV